MAVHRQDSIMKSSKQNQNTHQHKTTTRSDKQERRDMCKLRWRHLAQVERPENACSFLLNRYQWHSLKKILNKIAITINVTLCTPGHLLFLTVQTHASKSQALCVSLQSLSRHQPQRRLLLVGCGHAQNNACILGTWNWSLWLSPCSFHSVLFCRQCSGLQTELDAWSCSSCAHENCSPLELFLSTQERSTVMALYQL